MLNDPGVRHLTGGIIDHCIALIIVHRQLLRLKPDTAVGQGAEPVVIERVNHAGEQRASGNIRQLPAQVKVVCIQLNIRALQQLFHNLVVPAHGDALIPVIEIIVVKSKPNRKPLDDKRGQRFAVPPPLLLRIALASRKYRGPQGRAPAPPGSAGW